MVEGLFFYDGCIEDLVEEKAEYDVIDARYGYTNNIEQIKKIIRSSLPHLVLTNQIALLSSDWAWDGEKREPKIYLKDKSDGRWKNITRFTDKDIRKYYSLENMYKRGEFNREKAFRQKAPKKSRDILRLRVK